MLPGDCEREVVTGNAAPLVRAPTRYLCKAPGEGDLAARMLLDLNSQTTSYDAGYCSVREAAGRP